MVLTEEECKAAVNDIEYDLCELEERKTGVDVCCLYNENLEIFRELVKEYFQLKEKYNKLLDDVHDYRYETNRMKMTIRNLCKHNADNDMIIMSKNEQIKLIKNPQPYKFEDLKVGMWMWDDEERECRKILETYVTGEDNDVYVKGVRIVRHGLHEFNWKYSIFKEGRFFPVTKAMEYQE